MKLRHILGVSAGFHDAALSVVRSDGHIVFAAHSERYSKIKNHALLAPELIAEATSCGIDEIAFYERPWMHNLQQLVSGQRLWAPWRAKSAVRDYLGAQWSSGQYPIRCWPHHLSHAAAGFQTSPFDSAAVVVIDAIGELDTISIYHAHYDSRGRAQYQRLWKQTYPHSIGLFYTAVTAKLGLKPMEDEYITMGMAAYGIDIGTTWLQAQLVRSTQDLTFTQNLHRGLPRDLVTIGSEQDLARGAQTIAESLIASVMQRAQELTGSDNLVYGGGVALNCVANRLLGRWFPNVWIMPNPGDAGSSLGAAALSLGTRLRWKDAYLGHNIPGAYPVQDLLEILGRDHIAAVASGRAEWGPRALGNRSLLADPRGAEIKDRVNQIKQRQKFRPFAPAVLAEHADQYFDIDSPRDLTTYMQTVARCKYPDQFPAIVHADGTSRVQTVPASGSGFRKLLEAWYQRTGCPMLLNTSLNVRGEPMVNDLDDARRWQTLYGVRVCC
jgi:carbamoyltransferase